VLKKTSACIGLVVATAAGALPASSPAYAQADLARDSHHYRSHHHNRNWNGNRHHGRIFIRIYIYNKNTNHAQALAAAPRRHRSVRFVRSPGGVVDGVRPMTSDQDPAITPEATTPEATTPQATTPGDSAPASTTPDTTTPRDSQGTTGTGAGAGTGIGADQAPRDATPSA
jgi:hypothetical protein